MARSTKSKKANPIIQADEEIEIEDMDGPEPDENDIGYFDDELTTDDVEEIADSLETNARHQVEASRLAGKNRVNKGKASKSAVSKHENLLEWRPANTLEAPPPRAGMVQRWIRFTLSNEDDPKNWTRKTREGWVPRTLDTVAEGYSPPTIAHAKHGTLIGVGDLILCEMPRELHQSRKRYFREKWERQLAAIERRPLAEVEQRGGPRIRRTNKKDVTFGRRKANSTVDDE